MCGLFGWFSSFCAQGDVDKFNFLMFLSTTRGKDSTGVMSLIRHGHYNQEKDVQYHFLKAPVPAWEFQKYPEYHSLTKTGQDIKGFMGHDRAATVGSINSDNAHPFESPNGNIVLAHNGTISGDYPFKQDGRTDSEAMAALIESEGLKGLSKVSGAWAFTFLDLVNNTFNIIRNRERPLFFLKTTQGDFGYASEKWMLEALKDKFDIKGDVIDLEPYKLLSLDLMEDRYIESLSISSVEGLEAPKYNTYNGGRFRGAYGSDWWPGSETDDEPLHWRRPGYLGYEPTGPHSRVEKATNGVSVAATGRVGGGQLITEAQKKREEAVKVSKEKEGKTTNVVGFPRDPQTGKFLPAASSTSTKESDKTAKANDNRNVGVTPPKRRDNLPLVKGLPEQQRLVMTGEVEVETIKGHWMPMEDFLLLLEFGSCKWTNEATSLLDKRYWLNKTEWISETAWEDPEIQGMYGQDPSVLNQFLN